MESPRKFNDCYFYYYSTCTKGDNCVFRHEPTALGCETMCSLWQQGKCLDKRCKLRHMELRKNRKQIPCYWETQPGGCRKKHCSFMHKNPEARIDGILPSQPLPAMPAHSCGLEGGPAGGEPAALSGSVPGPAPPAPVPLLWQQQRQVVLDSAILGVLPGSAELLGARRVLPPHPHAHAHPHPHHPHPHDPAPNPYAQLPVDPLVVNFEEGSDSESAPSSTPTKCAPADGDAGGQSHELRLLEQIQAEAAAYYSYDGLAPPAPDAHRERKLVRANLTKKYDRVSLDELAGKQTADRRNSLDFKVLSLDEIRARKKTEVIIHSTPITLNLSRKRKLSTHEVNTASGNKVIKVVRSNSIVYKKVDPEAPAATNPPKVDQKQSENTESRKRTISENIDIYDNIQEDELVDNVHEFKRVKIGEQTSKPRLIRNRYRSTTSTETREDADVSNKSANDSDTEVQIVSVGLSNASADLSDIEVIDIDSANLSDSVDIVDLSDDEDDTEVTITNFDIDLGNNVPDVVASCHKKSDNFDKDVLKDIDNILDDDL